MACELLCERCQADSLLVAHELMRNGVASRHRTMMAAGKYKSEELGLLVVIANLLTWGSDPEELLK